MNSNEFLTQIFSCLNARRDLTNEQIHMVIESLMSGRCTDSEAAAFLLALRAKGESASEIAAAARVMRQFMLGWDSGRQDVLDTCGTGGDGAGTFNISTAAALVAAGAGAAVVKHGNRSVSSRSGSADVLACLGIRIDGDVDFARRCLQEASFAFCFAPNFHPALKNVAAVRRSLGVPTIFNCLGPLANPATATRQLIGVGRLELLDLIAEALCVLGTENALVVFSTDGLDEISLCATTLVREVRYGKIQCHEWTPADFGLQSCSRHEFLVPHADASAVMIKEVLHGNKGACERVILANAAAALMAAGKADSLLEGVAKAREAIASGNALRVLTTLQKLSSVAI